MFGRNKQASASMPKMSKQHQKIRQEVVKSREMLLAEIARLERKFDIAQAKRKP